MPGGTAILVQARSGSTRLPGKVLATVGDHTVLAEVLRRCRAVPDVDAVVCAVPDNSSDDPVAEEAGRAGAMVFRGSEDDVLDRYLQAARWVGAEVVLRVTSDCPLLDPAVCDAVLRLRANENADYACNNMPPEWPHGLDCEAMTREALEHAAREATAPADREHVTPYLRRAPNLRRTSLRGPGGFAAEQRWTLDTPADLDFLRAVFARLPAGPEGWDYRAPLGVVRDDPSLAAINELHAGMSRPGMPHLEASDGFER